MISMKGNFKMKRLLLGIVFVLVLFSLCTYHWMYCDLHELPENEDVVRGDHTGKRVSLFGVVNHADNFSITIEYGDKSRGIEVISPRKVDEGDKVEVLGVMLDADIIEAEEVMVYDGWSYNFIFIRSAFAIPVLALVFFRYWSFSLREFRFRRR